MASESALRALMKMRPPLIDELERMILETNKTLDQQITSIHDQFASLGKLINMFLFQNIQYISGERMQKRSLGLMSDFVDVMLDYDRFFQGIA